MAIPHTTIPPIGGGVYYVLLTKVVYGSKQDLQKCNRRDLWQFHTVQSLLLEEEFITFCSRSKQAPRKCNRRDLWPFHTVQSLVLEEEFMTSCLRRLVMVPSTLRGSVRGGIYGHSTQCNSSCLRRSSLRPAYRGCLWFQVVSAEV